MNKKTMIDGLSNPRKECRGRTRWWWYGCSVEKEEILRELDFIADAGLGGVELQILYPLDADDVEKGIKHEDYLSPGYMENIRFAAEEAAKRGLQFDLTLGSSWPFGGPFITEEMSGQSVLPFCLDVQGPCKFQKDLTTVVYGKVVGAVLGKMDGVEMIPESIVDIRSHVVDKYLFNWPWGTEIEEIDVPEGLHKIVLFVSSDKKQRVLKPLNGGDGLIMDHNRKEALREFLKYGGDPIVEAVGEGKITNFFCDSIEVFGHNWTNILYDEFKKRRGYELAPYIYALWGEVKGMTEQVRYDFQKTMAELTVENFFQELTTWCHEKGALSRIQAHGTWGDVLAAYGAADIPEGETFSEFDRYAVNTIHRKLASSAGHVYKKPIISNESFTWLRFPRFVVSLENIKAAADSIFLDGINQIINHGYSYSREGEEMLSFYASSNINHTNTWWKYYKTIGSYINRVCDFLQKGKPVITTAIYLPQHDIWAEMPIADTHMCMKLNERMDERAINQIHKSGYWFDYVNDEAVERWEEFGYDTLILLECERIPVETMKKIREIAAKGTKIIAAEHLPAKSCGLIDYEANTETVLKIGRELEEAGSVVVTEDKFDHLVEALAQIKKPDVKICNHSDVIGYVHRETETGDIYFLSNISKEDCMETVRFYGRTTGFAIYDPMDNKEKSVVEYRVTDEGCEIDLCMEAYQSLLVVFDKEITEAPLVQTEPERNELLDISENWTMKVLEKNFQKEYNILDSWEKNEELRYYSGAGYYEKTLVIDSEEWEKLGKAEKLFMEFEHIGECAEIRINGRDAGVLIKHPHRMEITGFLQEGENRIEILASNLLINRMINPDYPEPEMEPVITQWPYQTGGLEQKRDEFLYNSREREMIKEPLQSGIWGRVTVTGSF